MPPFRKTMSCLPSSSARTIDAHSLKATASGATSPVLYAGDMSATPRLYHGDSLLLAFDAKVTGHASWQGKPSILLDRTAFYPESGGQMSDRGKMAGSAVVDVQVDDADVVHHLLEGPLPAIGADVHGEIDAVRRRLHMALHTGQHMLSRALCDVAEADTVSSRLGETGCTIDVDRNELDERAVAEAEALVNSVIDDDVAIRAFFPDAEELAALSLRRKPKVDSHIRVVAIGEFDVSPCGGTHCLRTAQVGLVKVTGLERYKGKMRVGFSAGRRAREELVLESDVLHALGRDFTCGPTDVLRPSTSSCASSPKRASRSARRAPSS